MELNKLILTSQTGHFGNVLSRGDKDTLRCPPPSTIIGMLKVIYGDDIDNFKFGYYFNYSGEVVKDSITIYKHGNVGINNKLKPIEKVTDCHYKEMLIDCKLIIYTDLDEEFKMNYPLSMGRTGNPVRLKFPVEKVNLIHKEGKGFNQYTPISIGTGTIKRRSLISNYDVGLNLYNHQSELIRFNKEVRLDKYYDKLENMNIILYEVKNREVTFYD